MTSDRTRDVSTHEHPAHEHLIHQEKMSSLGRLVAGLAHELNNPINFIYGNVDILAGYVNDLARLIDTYEKASEALPPETRAMLRETRQSMDFDFVVTDLRKLVQSIRTGAERTAGIVRDLRAFSHVDGGEPRPYDLVRGIETSLNLIVPLLKNRVTVVRDFEPELPAVVCLPGPVNQVFMNILTNAAQAIEGKGELRVSARALTHPDVHQGRQLVEVKVADSGPGVPPDLCRRVFDPFFTTKEVGEGIGLGLSVADGVVRKHRGEIWCQSDLGSPGATFIVRLPVKWEGPGASSET